MGGSGSCGATKYFARLTEGSARVSQCLEVGSCFCRRNVSSCSVRSLFELLLVADGMCDLRKSRNANDLLVVVGGCICCK